MAKWQMKTCSTSLINKEIKIISYHLRPLKQLLKRLRTSNVGKEVEQPEFLYIIGRKVKQYNPFRKLFGNPIYLTMYTYCKTQQFYSKRKYVHKNLVHECSQQLIHNKLTLNTAEMSTHKKLDKRILSYLYNGTLLSMKKNY